MHSLIQLIRNILFLSFAFGAVVLAHGAAEKDKPPIRIVYSANRQGEIDPCGCQVNQTGGLNRVQTLLDQEKKNHPDGPVLFVDSGDTFFSAPALNPDRTQQEALRARIIAEAYRKFGVDALMPGERDFAAGWELLKELRTISGTVFVASNLTDAKGDFVFERLHVFHKGSFQIAVVGLADEKAFEGVKDVKVLPPMDTWKELQPKIKETHPDFVVVLSHLGLPRDRELANIGGMSLIFGSHSLDVLSSPKLVGHTYIFQPQNAGAQIGLLDYRPSDPAASYHRLVDLLPDYDKDNDVAKLQAKYKDQVRALAIESSHLTAEQGKMPFVAHAYYCRTCHQKQYDFWESTKHASAYLVLFSKNQHFNPECIGCHSLGFRDPAGFSAIASPVVLDPPEKPRKGGTPYIEKLMKKVFSGEGKKNPLDSRLDPARYQKLKKRYHGEIHKLEAEGKIARLYVGVQCEHCHGNRSGHPNPEVPTIKKVSETSCRMCHVSPNAPIFDPGSFSKVACPLSDKL